MHALFYNWILKQESFWKSQGIETEKIINLIENPSNPDYPFVCVQHVSPHVLGQISLHRVCDGYILDFEAVRVADEVPLMYHLEFSDSPDFDLWQIRYVDFFESCFKDDT
jgi:hypothetical protein